MAVNAGEILNDVTLLVDLFAKLTTNVVEVTNVLNSGPADATAAEQIAAAKAKLATIQTQAGDIDAQFDAALEAALAEPEAS